MGSSLLTFRARGNRVITTARLARMRMPHPADGERSEVPHVDVYVLQLVRLFALHAGVVLIAALATVAAVKFLLGQTSANPSLGNGGACPPDTEREPATGGGGGFGPLSGRTSPS